MGYCASGGGEIMVKSIPEEEFERLKTVFEDEGYEFDRMPTNFKNQDEYVSVIKKFGIYDEDNLNRLLNELAPYTVEGSVEFTGEDDSRWRYIYRNGEWHEEDGEISYVPYTETSKWKVYVVDGDNVHSLRLFEGAREEASAYAKSLIVETLREERYPSNVKKVTFNEGDCEWAYILERHDGTFATRYFDEIRFHTVEDIPKKGRKLVKKYAEKGMKRKALTKFYEKEGVK